MLASASRPGRAQPAFTPTKAADAAAAVARTIRQQWPAGAVPEQARPGAWTYEVGTVLDGMAAQWEVAHDQADLTYIQQTVDRWIDKDGSILIERGKPFPESGHTLDNIEPGRAVLLCYHVTKDERYRKAADYLHAQLEAQPRNSMGGYWHKQVYPDQMWLDGAYMAEPFRAAYASMFHKPDEFADIAKQFLLMHDNMRDRKTGLLRHGWDASHREAWADKQTGLSQEVWARAMGWYAMALVDTLPWLPSGHPDRAKLIAVLQETAKGITQFQDAQTGLWWDVLDRGSEAGNFREASASAMFTYALAKGARLGYLPLSAREAAVRGWKGIGTQFVTYGGDAVTLHGTVKVSGLGGNPYRAGDYSYYVHEAVADNDTKGVGAYLLAAGEMERLEAPASRKTKR